MSGNCGVDLVISHVPAKAMSNIIVALTVLSLALLVSAQSNNDLIVSTQYGPVQGFYHQVRRHVSAVAAHS